MCREPLSEQRDRWLKFPEDTEKCEWITTALLIQRDWRFCALQWDMCTKPLEEGWFGWWLMGGMSRPIINAFIRQSGKESFFLWGISIWGLTLPSLWCPFSSLFVLSLFSNAPALCPLYPSTYYQIQANKKSKSKGFTIRHLDLDLPCITCQVFRLLNLSKPQFSLE